MKEKRLDLLSPATRHEAGKGDGPREDFDYAKYRENYDKIEWSNKDTTCKKSRKNKK